MGSARCPKCNAVMNKFGVCVNACHERAVEAGESFLRRVHVRDLLHTLEVTIQALKDELE